MPSRRASEPCSAADRGASARAGRAAVADDGGNDDPQGPRTRGDRRPLRTDEGAASWLLRGRVLISRRGHRTREGARSGQHVHGNLRAEPIGSSNIGNGAAEWTSLGSTPH